MPKLEVTLPQDSLSNESREELPEQLAATLLRWEGAPDTEFFRSIAWAHLHELPAAAMRTPDGQADPHAVVEVTVPSGALSERRKAGLVEDMTDRILEATGWGAEAALRVWVLISEVPDGNWGAGKQVIRFEQLREAAKAEREKAEPKEPAEATA
jgi:phenylpyruvate tautomerase PptA (4-oxalocrotonate tautomerase family)